ncbi:MAG: orotidine-5'-phosphate decarboxylase [Deltaproteobacteria bacterium]|nr:orotidine-5'-phosphate decarboxylase [Deltaproteobacteria bacterium]
MDAIDLARNRLVFALDIDDPDAALACARQLAGTLKWVKVATRLYTRAGAKLVRELQDLGYSVFLDLKFHDIPDQVEGACRAAAQLGVGLLTVHASGGRAMLEAAARGAAEGSTGRGDDVTRVLAVTVLTSLDQSDLTEIGYGRALDDQVGALARLAREAGCDGVVASPKELPLLRDALRSPFGILTPGIRPVGAAVGDQKRVTTPGDAVRGGADWLVVGRPIRNAEDRVAAAEAILDEMAAAL